MSQEWMWVQSSYKVFSIIHNVIKYKPPNKYSNFTVDATDILKANLANQGTTQNISSSEIRLVQSTA